MSVYQSALRVPQEAIDDEAMMDIGVAATDNRAIVGTLVDFARMLEVFEGDDRTLRTLALDLAGTPCSVLNGKSPRRATSDLFTR